MIKQGRAILITCGIFFISVFSTLQANLDGTTGTSIYLASNYTFTNNELARGYVALEGGFTVPNGGTAFVGVNQEVGGLGRDINLNNGTLVLLDDLYLGAGAFIVGTGTIVGNSKTIFLAFDTVITSSINFRLPDKDNVLFINLQNNLLVFGGIQNPDVSFRCGLDGDPFTTLIAFRHGRLANVAGGKTEYPLNHGTQGSFQFANTRINLAGQELTLFGDDNAFLSDNDIIGVNSRLHFNCLSVAMGAIGRLHIFPLVELLVNTAAGGFSFGGKNSRLVLDNCSLTRNSDALGLPWNFTGGIMTVNGVVTVDIEPGQQPLVIGDGLSETLDLNVEINPGSTLRLLRGAIDYNNVF